MLNPYGATSGGDRVDDSGIGSRGCGEAATLGCSGSVEKGLGHAAPLAPCATPENLRKNRPPGRWVAGGWRARDPDQPIWGTLTWPRGPDALPTPSSAGKGGAGGYAPSPNATSVSGGGDTPDYILPPHQAKGNSGAPLEGSGIQVLHCGGRLNPENHHRRRPVATPRRAEPGYAHAAPSSPAAWPMEELRMARPAQAWQSPAALGLDGWKDFVGRGGRERVLHPCQPPSFPGFAEPQRNQLAQRCGGLPLPWGSMRHSSAW